jgi:acetylornithine deacetylase/succinyl-diaminopimelate desuccinylase-like protein
VADLKKVFGKQDEAAMIQMARDVIDIPSPTGEEGPMADYIARRFRELGLQIEMQEVELGRNNVIARLRGARARIPRTTCRSASSRSRSSRTAGCTGSVSRT